ncbi:hypothetical protein KAI32_02980 [Candidatus Pacearchaeota archaeon]|nr:hypothetical protein [Candidatus Pacearchaeota archaeon]
MDNGKDTRTLEDKENELIESIEKTDFYTYKRESKGNKLKEIINKVGTYFNEREEIQNFFYKELTDSQRAIINKEYTPELKEFIKETDSYFDGREKIQNFIYKELTVSQRVNIDKYSSRLGQICEMYEIDSCESLTYEDFVVDSMNKKYKSFKDLKNKDPQLAKVIKGKGLEGEVDEALLDLKKSYKSDRSEDEGNCSY